MKTSINAQRATIFTKRNANILLATVVVLGVLFFVYHAGMPVIQNIVNDFKNAH